MKQAHTLSDDQEQLIIARHQVARLEDELAAVKVERDEARGLIRHLRKHVVDIVDAGEFWYASPVEAGGYAPINESHVRAFKAMVEAKP